MKTGWCSSRRAARRWRAGLFALGLAFGCGDDGASLDSAGEMSTTGDGSTTSRTGSSGVNESTSAVDDTTTASDDVGSSDTAAIETTSSSGTTDGSSSGDTTGRCPVGTAGCACTERGQCDRGLTCFAMLGVCVDEPR